MKKNYQFLNNINFPSDLRKVSENNLQKDQKVSMTHLEQHRVQHLFHLH